MNSVSRLLRSGLAVLMLAGPATASPKPYGGIWARCPRVQMAILLDTSNSMDGLIDQAKSQLWRAINDLAYAKRRGRTPYLEVALYEYGNDNLSPGENYIRQVLPFTESLDEVSEHLSALHTRGGHEYCGAVIRDAVSGLPWDRDDDTYKVVFIAGNEPFTQGPVYFRDAIRKASGRGILVNTIFCGPPHEGIRTDWLAGAQMSGGRYMTIDQNRVVRYDPTPYDDEIELMGRRLNDTFIGYGAKGRAQATRMAAASSAISSLPKDSGALYERRLNQASAQYAKPDWDLVAKVQAQPGSLESLAPSELPAGLRGKDKKDLEAHLKTVAAEREALQNMLASLKLKRDKFLAERKKSGPDSLDEAMRGAIRDQAGKKGFTFDH